MIRLDHKNVLFPEQLGTKAKSWVIHAGKQCLFKIGRKGTGENWAEVVACGLCRLLEMPCADYQFAELEGEVGVLTETIVPENGRLVFGNELLAKYVEQYEQEKKYKQRQYTLRSVIALLKNLKKNTTTPYDWKPIDLVSTPLDVFTGYLLLDALIGNQDRHHENWGLVISFDSKQYLAHSFDHASSLGRNETDAVRQERLTTRDARRSLEMYVTRAKSAFYTAPTPGKRLSTLEAFAMISGHNPAAGDAWVAQLDNLSKQSVSNLFQAVPEGMISQPAIDFAVVMIMANKSRILKAHGSKR
jgi:hypothetical protein